MTFLVLTVRRLLRERYFAALNLLSLILGVCGALLIGLYLFSELSYDRFHQRHAQIYRVFYELGDVRAVASGYEVGAILQREYPQIENFVNVREAHEQRFSHGDNAASWEYAMLADPSLFEVFTFTVLSGDPVTALSDPYSIALSESMARFYFGDRDPLGELLSTEQLELRVSLVFEDLPENVSQRFDAVLPLQLMEVYEPEYLEGMSRFTGDAALYLLVNPSFDPADIEAISERFFQDHMQAMFQRISGDMELGFSMGVQPLTGIHFGEALLGAEGTANPLNISLFTTVAITLLLVSCINYVNLATARATTRSREVAMRKILGAGDGGLMLRFLAESIVMVASALMLGIALTWLLIRLGIVEQLTGKAELLDVMLVPQVLTGTLAAGLMISLLTGLYPAYVVSRPSMMALFRPTSGGRRRDLYLRQLLVFLQMGLAMVIVTSMFLMRNQTSFVLGMPLGFKVDEQLVVTLQGADAIRSRRAIMNELIRHPRITNVVEGFDALGRGLSVNVLQVEDNAGEQRMATTHSMRLGTSFLDSLEIELIQGIGFSEERAQADINPLLVNETLVREMGWDQALGKQIGNGEVIGVVKDYHYLALHEPIGPVWIAPFDDGYLDNLTARQQANADIVLMIKTTGKEQVAAQDHIQQVVAQFSQQSVIQVNSLRELWSELYEDDRQLTGIVGLFASISIVISLLGLAGLATYNNQQRGKELAVRRVLGATSIDLLFTLGIGTGILLLLVAVPAGVIAYLGVNPWLESFAFRASPSVLPYMYGFAAMAVSSTAVLLVQVTRSARSNPVNTLRYE